MQPNKLTKSRTLCNRRCESCRKWSGSSRRCKSRWIALAGPTFLETLESYSSSFKTTRWALRSVSSRWRWIQIARMSAVRKSFMNLAGEIALQDVTWTRSVCWLRQSATLYSTACSTWWRTTRICTRTCGNNSGWGLQEPISSWRLMWGTREGKAHPVLRITIRL